MKRRIIDRYEVSPEGEIIVDVGVRTVEDLYDHFDRTAAYLKKDLNQDFADFLIDCVKEIRSHPFRIRITLNQPESEERMERVRSSLQSYFLYARDVERAKLRFIFRRSLILIGLGAVLVVGSFRLRTFFGGEPSLLVDVLGEGVTVAAWVSLWTAFASLIFDWGLPGQNLRAYRRIVNAKVAFQTDGRETVRAA